MKIEDIALGQKVRWNDPAINDYDEEDREDALNREWEIYDYDKESEVVWIADGFSEAEVYACELDLIV